jgi:hypothetical protein
MNNPNFIAGAYHDPTVCPFLTFLYKVEFDVYTLQIHFISMVEFDVMIQFDISIK